jgi:predicted dehydrogenase
VGCGYIGTRHAILFDRLDGVQLKAVCDVDGERAEAVASQLGVKAYTSAEEMVLHEGIDAVSVATSGSHAGPAEIAARAGKHVMVETSFATTLEDCDRMISAAERSGVNMMYCGTHRFYPYNTVAKAMVEGGELGDVIWITRRFTSEGVPGDDRWARWRETGGGFFMRTGAILIDHLRWLADSDIEEVYTAGMGRYVTGGDGEDNAMATFKFKNGVFASMLGTSTNPGNPGGEWLVGGTQGMIKCTRDAHLSLGKGEWQAVPYEGEEDDAPEWFPWNTSASMPAYVGWRREFEEFVASIREKRPPAVTGYDGKACTEAAIAAVMSYETGGPVRLPL